jgi:hypothetical protein
MAKDEPQVIRFSAQVFKVATLIDGGLRLTLDLPASDPDVIVALFEAKQPGVTLEVAAVAITAETLKNLDKNANNKEKAKAGAPGVDRGRLIKHGDQ